MKSVALLGVTSLLVLGAIRPAGAQQSERPGYERDMPAALAAQAKIRENSARANALGRVPGGVVEALDDSTVSVDSSDEKPTVRAGVLRGVLVLDGRLREPAWRTADSIKNLTTIEPEEGGTPAGRTIVKVLASPTDIIVGVICRDTNPRGIVSASMGRDDSALTREDHVMIVIDPFRDGRSGYVFAVNPAGARFDGLVTARGEEVNSDWDAVWEAHTSRDNLGWSVEIRIPVRSLSFKPGSTTWGFNVQRRVQRLQEISRWSGANGDYEVFQTSQAGLLTGLPNFDLGLGLTIRPSIVGNSTKPAPGANWVSKMEGSLDVTKKLGSNLVSSLTVNTDFGETEVDARHTNLTRFDLFFPEKRTFFLEGMDIFDFGLGTGEDVIPFFSRRIGLVGEEGNLQQVPLTVGGKLNGRAGNTNLGALVVRTRSIDTLETDATIGVVRVKQNILAESSVGMIATAGDPLALPGSWMSGVDFTYQTSKFQGDKKLLMGVWGVLNHSNDVGGDRAFGGMIDVGNVALAYKNIGTDFSPSLGFVPRTGVQIYQLETEFEPPAGGLVRQMTFQFNPSLVTDLSGSWQSYLVSIKPLDWRLESGDRFEFTFEPQGDRPTQDFDVFESTTQTVIIPAGSYRWTRYGLQAALAGKRPISGEAKWSTGTFYNGYLNSVVLTLVAKPTPHLSVEFGMERNSAHLPQIDFIQRLYSGRLQVNMSPDLQVASFLQYDNESRNFGSNTRLRWTFTPLGNLFVVYNHNMQRNLNNRFTFGSNQLLVKLQYALRP